MNVRFTTADFGDEAASVAAAQAGQAPEEESYVFGQVVLEHQGQPELAWYDDLSFLVPRLCVAAPAALEREGTAQARLIDWPNTIYLAAEGDAVHLTGDNGEDASYPRTELLAALRACATRFADFLAVLAVHNPAFQARERDLRAALEAGGGTGSVAAA